MSEEGQTASVSRSRWITSLGVCEAKERVCPRCGSSCDALHSLLLRPYSHFPTFQNSTPIYLLIILTFQRFEFPLTVLISHPISLEILWAMMKTKSADSALVKTRCKSKTILIILVCSSPKRCFLSGLFTIKFEPEEVQGSLNQTPKTLLWCLGRGILNKAGPLEPWQVPHQTNTYTRGVYGPLVPLIQPSELVKNTL